MVSLTRNSSPSDAAVGWMDHQVGKLLDEQRELNGTVAEKEEELGNKLEEGAGQQMDSAWDVWGTA